VIFTTSWDDGHPLDVRLGELLSRHGFAGTFYIPCTNREGRAVMNQTEIRTLGSEHEIGSHTFNHCYLRGVGPAEARHQIYTGKQELEQTLGRTCEGFCYPGGQGTEDPMLRAMVRDAGFVYARTTTNLEIGVGADPYRMPTTLQFYPHGRDVLVRNFISKGNWLGRAHLFSAVVSKSDVLARLMAAISFAFDRAGVFHLWGHSWELEQFGGWQILDEFLGRVAQLVPPAQRLTNSGTLHLHAA
jgi:hypothetical protein